MILLQIIKINLHLFKESAGFTRSSLVTLTIKINRTTLQEFRSSIKRLARDGIVTAIFTFFEI